MKDEWTEERVRDGFDRFARENGRLPTATEVDDCQYLPTSRLIQLKFGGLKKLRSALGYEDTDFGSGSPRSRTATRITRRGAEVERELESYLVGYFGEMYVHSEKRYGPKQHRVDFVVFSPDGNLGIDVFYPTTLTSMMMEVRIKADKYVNFPKGLHLFFVVANDGFSQEQIDSCCRGSPKLDRLSSVRVTTLKGLYAVVSHMRRFDDPPGYQPIAPV